MSQVNNRKILTKLAAGAGVIVAAAFFANLLFTPAKEVQLDAKTMSTITEEGTFRTVHGDGSRAIHVFISADCSFCRQLEPRLDGLDNVTIYRHLLPGHSEAGRVAANAVWCANEPVQAWKEIAAGGPTVPTRCDSEVLRKNLALAQRLGLTSTPSVIYADGHVSPGLVSTEEMATRIKLASRR